MAASKTDSKASTDTFDPQVGDFLVETLVTDTVGWEVIARTASTLTLRTTQDGEVIHRTNAAYPVVLTAIASRPDGPTTTVRRRKDGTFRLGGGSALRPAPTREGVPFTRTDYSF